MPRLKDGAGMAYSIWAPQTWAVTAIWLFLAFFCYEMMRQQSDRLFHLASIVQSDVELLHRSKSLPSAQST